MKFAKLFFSLLAVFFGFSLVMVSALRLSWQAAQASSEGIMLAQEEEQTKMDEASGDESMAMDKAEDQAATDMKGDYYLPYPGILPDHPLYWLKMVRDRVMLWATRDPMQQFQRLLLYADKRIGAAQALIEGGQTELGVTTATKAEKYLERAVNQYQELKAAGKINPETEDRLKQAILKHQELLEAFLQQAPDQAKAGLEKALETTKLSLEVVGSEAN